MWSTIMRTRTYEDESTKGIKMACQSESRWLDLMNGMQHNNVIEQRDKKLYDMYHFWFDVSFFFFKSTVNEKSIRKF